MRLLFAGTPEVAVPSLTALLASRHEVVGVLTRPDAPVGRGRRMRPSAVAEAARERGLPVFAPERVADIRDAIADLGVECSPVVAYGGLIPGTVLEQVPRGWINLHFSLLPAWRGAAPVQYALWRGDDVTGATTFLLDEGLDTGPTLGMLTEPVLPDDTTGSLLHRLSHSGAELLVRTLDAWEDRLLVPSPQSPDGVSLAPKWQIDDARIRWAEPATGVDRRIRASTPAPGAWTTLEDQRVRIGPVRLRPDLPDLAPGVVRVERHAVTVGTATAPVELGEVTPAGKRSMAAADWARGARLHEDAVLA